MEPSYFQKSNVRSVVFTGAICVSCGKGKEIDFERHV
jgi:hypothetical protein